jgi:hypothetical protein
MRKYEKRVEPVERNDLIETTCDLCGALAKKGHWESSAYEIGEVEIEVTVRQEDGTAYPEGGWGTDYMVDMCPGCFKNKLIPWLESQGCKAKRKEWDF